MVNRITKLSKSQSFFILGPRGSGKSTLIKQRFLAKNTLYIDLLDLETEDQYRIAPNTLKQQIVGSPRLQWVIIDEVQKLPNY